QRSSGSDAALVDANQALHDAREIDHAATLMFALALTSQAHFLSADYATVGAANDELLALAYDKNARYWKAVGTVLKGNLFAVTGRTLDAIQETTSGLTAFRSTGATLYVPSWLSFLARPTRISAKSTTLGAVLARRQRRSK